jgi:large subunit ribosomal protein L28
MVKCRAFASRHANWNDYPERIGKMAKCNNCGKTTSFGHNRSFSLRATNRTFKPNLQKVKVMEQGRLVKKTLCARCIKTLGKAAA